MNIHVYISERYTSCVNRTVTSALSWKTTATVSLLAARIDHGRRLVTAMPLGKTLHGAVHRDACRPTNNAVGRTWVSGRSLLGSTISRLAERNLSVAHIDTNIVPRGGEVN